MPGWLENCGKQNTKEVVGEKLNGISRRSYERDY